MAFYLKYRPQTLDQIVGQDNVRSILSKSVQNSTLFHAYLFCGPKGSGKTSTARILAKMVNCELTNQLTNNQIPCNKCDTCTSITDGSNLDLIEIDAASNRGIDDIRALRENLKLAPTSSKKKVYIIDEAHMLTAEAFNGLLKTLEEPPSHVIFILATTEPQKIPQTILSRVQRLNFTKASDEQLLEVLTNIAQKEKIKIEPQVLKLLAKKSDGSFRDGTKILEQITSLDGAITAETIEATFKSGTLNSVYKLLEALSEKDAREAILEIKKQEELGVSARDFIQNLMDSLRSLLYLKHGLTKLVTDDDINKLSEKLSLEDVIRLLKLIQQAAEKTKVSQLEFLPLEVAVAESCQLSVLGYQPASPAGRPASPAGRLSDNSQPVVSASVQTEKQKTGEQDSDNRQLKTDNIDIVINDQSDLSKLLDKWQLILETIKPYNYSLEALLKQVKLLSCQDGKIVLEVPYSFHQRILEAPKSKNLLESVFSDILGKVAVVSCILGQRPIRDEEVVNVEMAQDDEIVKIASEIFNSEGG